MDVDSQSKATQPTPAADAAAHHKEREHFFGAAKIIAGLTLLSRIGGMLRGMGIAWLGASRYTDVFQTAFAIPNLFRRLLGEGAFAGAFVPVLTETMERDGFDAASRLFANALGLLSAVLVTLTALICAGVGVWALLTPSAGEDIRLLQGLLAVMMPFMIFICLMALASAALNCRGHFAYPAAAPILLNGVVLAGLWVIAPLLKTGLIGTLYVVAASVTAAGAIQLALGLWLDRRQKYIIRPCLRPVHPGIKPMVRLMAPLLLGLGFLQLTSLFDYVAGLALTATETAKTFSLFGREIVRPLTPGVLVRLNAASTLYQFPMGVLAISLGVAVFPLLSRYAARGDMPNLREAFNRALRLSFMEGLATGTGLFVLAKPIIAAIFQHGKFTAADTENSAFILSGYAAGLWAFCSYPILARCFYALKEPKVPLRISCVLAVVYMVSVLSLAWWAKAAAFSVSATGTFSLNVIILSYMLRRRLGRIGGRALVRSVARSVAACAAMAAALLALQWQLGMWGAKNWLVAAVCVPAGAAVFVLTARLLRAPELGELIGSLRKRKAEPESTPPASSV